MDPNPDVDAVLKILDLLAKAEPLVESAIESWLMGRKAKRVEEVRPATALVDDEVERLKRGTGA